LAVPSAAFAAGFVFVLLMVFFLLEVAELTASAKAVSGTSCPQF
jgi:hypothetical protein